MPATIASEARSPKTVSLDYARPEMPPPPYFQSHFVNPSSFKAAINTKIDKPLISLFLLSVRLLQFAFGLSSGISYAVELSHRNVTPNTNLIYAEVVFGLTLLVLVIDSITLRYYRVSWVFEWALMVLWFACFGVFYQIYLSGAGQEGYDEADLGRMRRAVWCDLINAILWFASATFSSCMCCTGAKAAIKSKLGRGRQKKQNETMMKEIGKMESGTTSVNPV
jgi:hypothetical protein